MNNDSITLSRLRFFGHHGVLPEERERGQFFEVTVRLGLPLGEAGRGDDLTKTVDYRVVGEIVRHIVEGPPRLLAETLAENIAAELLGKFPLVQTVDIDVTKAAPPVDFVFSGFTASIHRTRTVK